MGNLQKYENRNPVQKALIQRFLRHVERLAARAAPARLLDAGCGEGFVSEVLRRVLPPGLDIVGVDVRREALGDARMRAGLGPALASVNALPFARGAFDLVVATELLEHLVSPDAAMRELARVARRWLLVSVPTEPAFRGLNLLRLKNLRRFGSDSDHHQHFGRAEFLRLLGRYATVVEAPRGAFPWTLALARLRG